jgi:outer membrane immunogenic protein
MKETFMGGGVMKILFAVAALLAANVTALAADMPVKTRPIATTGYNWTGGYIGGSVGYGWDHRSADYQRIDCVDLAIGGIFGGCGLPGPLFAGTPPGPGTINGTGALAGLQAGYNQQYGATLVGVEFDYNWSRVKGEGVSDFRFFPDVFGPDSGASAVGAHKITSFATIRGRLGWLPTQTWLIYATGGVAFANVDHNVAMSLPSIAFADGTFAFRCPPGRLPCFLGASNRATVGWTVGAGSEVAVSPNITLKAEYLYANLAGESFTVRAVNAGGLIPSSFRAGFSHIDLHVARVGINYRLIPPIGGR